MHGARPAWHAGLHDLRSPDKRIVTALIAVFAIVTLLSSVRAGDAYFRREDA